MPKIRVLSDRVANQIAAGEVIERPAAVVKELLENSLDAGATRIEIEFKNGGRSLIRVEDNGSGMSKDDALLSIERHATSKIVEADDLNSIGSFGFRGEALPSIASVSRFELRSRLEGSDVGNELLLNGGKLIHVKECGMPQGTRIEVSHLFNSVPARRKFLKTDNTEAAHIIQLARIYAIANPQAAFSLIENGRLLFKSPVCPSVKERVREIFGNNVANNLMDIEAEETGFALSGLVGLPGKGRSSRHEMITIVNRRPVTSQTLNHALIEAYHSYLPRGKYPLAFLFLDMDPAAVDVNVHPSKREIRFRESARVRGFVIRSLLDRLREETGGAEAEAAVPTPVAKARIEIEPAVKKAVKAAEARLAPRKNVKAEVSAPLKPLEPAPITKKTATRKKAPDWQVTWKFVGHVQRGLAVFDSPTGLIVLDRRSAHQRVLFEELEKQYANESVAAQQLLLPVPLETDAIGSALLLEHLDFLNKNGFVISEFGRNFFRIEAVPVWTTPDEAEELVLDLIGLMKDGSLSKGKPLAAFSHIAKMACQKSVRLDDSVSEKEIVELASKLMKCQNPLISPLGRPTYFELTKGELDRKFHKS